MLRITVLKMLQFLTWITLHAHRGFPHQNTDRQT